MDIQIKRFDELSLAQLYSILQLRYNVFIFEQQSIFDEYDNKDQVSLHLFVEEHDAVVGYLRLYPESGKKYVIGRVCVRKDYRKKGLGRELVQKAVEYATSQKSVDTIALSAQEYLVDFYRTFGFRAISDAYDDAGVPHVDMVMEVG